jgi:hypothetical protein
MSGPQPQPLPAAHAPKPPGSAGGLLVYQRLLAQPSRRGSPFATMPGAAARIGWALPYVSGPFDAPIVQVRARVVGARGERYRLRLRASAPSRRLRVVSTRGDIIDCRLEDKEIDDERHLVESRADAEGVRRPYEELTVRTRS